MKKLFKILLWSLLGIALLAAALLAGFVYKIMYGFPVTYETEVPAITFPEGRRAVLLFSKATGFVHGESIEAGKAVFNELAGKNDWFLYSTDESGVFNMEQLSRFDAVIFNNSTGRVLNDEQQEQLRHYVEQGGTLIGIHGAGDNSHHWEWYVESLTGAPFSHHSLHPQLQDAVVTLNPEADSAITAGLPSDWTHTEEWYVFTENPGNRGFTIVYSIDGETINPDGNILWISDKNFGMGNEHPVAWYRDIGKGRTLYTSLGHDAGAWGQEGLTRLLENAVNSVPERGNQQD